ncbi:ATP-binding protein [Bacillus sp. EB600]|uniref:ATP-binding protein n=1 Tax=Bacillus sp. EB600 TaxID=2806345 RepID=UPI00210E7678|nr:ATP-binding protein [Bacillus sp. EB600]MCQ6279027.1 PAS domain S-box protein [Bacillus sp. EB600]
MSHPLQNLGNTFNLDHLVTIFNYLEDMVFLIDVEENDKFRCLEVNPAYLKGTGLQLHQIKNKRIEEIFCADEAAGVNENYLKAIFNKQSLTFEENLIINHIDKTFETTIIPIFIEDQQDCRYILGVSRDISDRKTYERTLLEAKSELESIIKQQQALILRIEKENEDFYHTLSEGRLFNQLGLTSNDLIGKRPEDMFPKEIAAIVTHHYQLCWESQEKVIFEFFDPTKQYEVYWLTVVSPIIENGQTTSLLVYAVDILDRKKSEESMMQTEKLALIGELAAGIGHELRNPLTAIKGFIQLMRENKQTVKDEFLDVIDAELESLNHIAGELMILAKPQVQNFSELNVIQLLNEVVFLLEPEAFRQGIKVTKKFESQFAPVYGEKYQLKQVFINLIKNALDALNGRSNEEITIKCELLTTETIVTISDNGCGIPKEILDKIGEPFYTTKEKGNGLGLLVSYRIIKNHNGTIECTSEEGNGTSFIIHFPNSSENT